MKPLVMFLHPTAFPPFQALPLYRKFFNRWSTSLG